MMNDRYAFNGRFPSILRRSLRVQALIVSALLPGLCFWTPVQANPTGGVVVHGDATINGGAGNLTINQNSQNAIINWDDFSIDAGELTRFVQPGTSAAVLNRVTGGNVSDIQGALQANGNVFVINPNGILIGSGGTIDVHGLVLSTLDVSNGEFLARGDQVFKGSSDAGITNMGRINAVGGDVFLISKTIRNAGTIKATGVVGFGAGEEVLLTAPDGRLGERVFVEAKGSGGSITNTGSIEAAAVELKQHGNIYAMGINNKGAIRATGTKTVGGRVYLHGSTVRNSGTIQATSAYGGGSALRDAKVLIEAAYAKVDGQIKAGSAKGNGGNVRIAATKADVNGSIDVSGTRGIGGSAIIEADEISVGSKAFVNASGPKGGGTINVGGGFQGNDARIRNATRLDVASGARFNADAKVFGNGGQVILWSDDETVFQGEISAQALAGRGDGGFVEVSGKQRLSYDGVVSTLSAGGENGTLLLDPTNLTIAASGGDITGTAIVAALGTNNVVILTDSAGTDDGDITIDEAIDWNSGNSLSLLAHGDIIANMGIQNQGAGDVNLVAGWDGTSGFSADGAAPAPISSSTANFSMDEIFNSTGSYGNGDGSIRLNANGSIVAIGSRDGETNLAGHDLILSAGGGNFGGAHIGFRDVSGRVNADDVDATGNIRIDLKNSLIQEAVASGVVNYVQIGHGGRVVNGFDSNPATNGAISNGSLRGNIDITVGIDGDGEIRLDGADSGAQSQTSGRGTNVQIGHGGYGNGGNHQGAITIVSEGTVGDITLAGSGTVDAYRKIGHGGRFASGSLSGAIEITSDNGTLSLAGGTQARTFTQIGHGGIDNGVGSSVDDMKSGAISINVGGDVSVSGGAVANAFAMIGHGGTDSLGGNSGDISINSNGGDISVTGGAGGSETNAFAMIGHGGRVTDVGVGDYQGDIEVVGANSLNVTGGGAQNAFAKIGHGGLNRSTNDEGEDVDLTSRIIGNINVDVIGDINVNGVGNSAFAQIGHGGQDVTFTTQDGDDVDLTVRSGGAIRVGGGAVRASFGIIGHGGNRGRGGVLNGDIAVTATDDIELTAGANAVAFALIGAGGNVSGGVAGTGGEIEGERLGSTSVTSETGDVTLTGGRSGANVYAVIGYGGRNSEATFDADVNVTAARNIFVRAGGGGNQNFALIGKGGSGSGGVTRGNTTVSAGENIELTGGLRNNAFAQIGDGGHDSSGTFEGVVDVTAGGEIDLTGGGNANGRFDRYALIGVGGALTSVDSSDDINVNVEAQGDVRLSGGERSRGSFAMIGTGGTLSSGTRVANIAVSSVNGNVELTGGSGENAAAFIGNGGFQSGGDIAGDIFVSAGQNITLTGGSGARSFAHIGAGGFNSDGAIHDSDVHVAGDALQLNGGTGQSSYAQIGLGGEDTAGDFQGDIFASFQSGVALMSSNADRALTMIGHGGFGAVGDHTGFVTVLNSGTGDITLTGGGGDFTSAQIGHGIYNSGDGDLSGSISVINTGGGILVETVSTTAQGGAMIGHGSSNTEEGGGARTGGINLYTTGSVTVDHAGGTTAGAFLTHQTTDAESSISYARAGASSNSALHGDSGYSIVAEDGIDLSNAGIQITGGNGVTTFAESLGIALQEGDVTLATGGTTDLDLSSFDGLESEITTFNAPNDLTFAAGGDLIVGFGIQNAGAGDINLIGGRSATALVPMMTALNSEPFFNASNLSFGTEAIPDFSPVVSLSDFGNNNGGVILGDAGQTGAIAIGSRQGNTNVLGQHVDIIAGSAADSSTQVGFQGADTSGDIVVRTRLGGDVTLTGGGANSQAQIGHGGVDVDGAMGGAINVITVDGGNLNLNAGDAVGGDAVIGHGDGSLLASSGLRTGNIDLLIDGDTTLTDGAAGLALLGHSNERQSEATDSDLTLVTNSVNRLGGIVDRVAQYGDAEIIVTGGDWIIGGDDFSYNGPGSAELISVGDITFTSSLQNEGSGGVSVIAGWDESGGLTRNVNLAGGDLSDRPITEFSIDIDALLSSKQFGENGSSVNIGDGTQTTGIAVGSAGGETQIGGHDVVITSGSSSGASAQIGHRGDVDTTGGIEVVALNNVELVAGSGSEAYVQIGHGGAGSNGEFAGDVSVSADNDINVSGGAGSGAYAHLGHGGMGARGSFSGVVGANAGNDLNLVGGDGPGSYVHVGHGGASATGEASGAVNVDARNDVNLSGGGAADAYSQIGHGGAGASGDASGAVTVDARNDVNLSGGGASDAYAQIGHGGESATVDASGAVTVDARNDVNLTGGEAADAYAQIGHGGERATGDASGAVSVDARNDVNLTGGGAADAYAQIGHGGAGASGNLSGDIVVGSDNNVTLSGGASQNGNYGKIGHGSFSGRAGSGSRSGNIEVQAGQDVVLERSMVGHVRASDRARNSSSGVTQIGVSRNNPTSPGGGSLITDASSELVGASEFRAYLPRRSSNQVAAGTLINGVSYQGAAAEGSALRLDEFAVTYVAEDGEIIAFNQHTNILGSGEMPLTQGLFGFYYDLISGPSRFDPEFVFPDTRLNLGEVIALLPGDRTFEDWQEAILREHSGYHFLRMMYEGYDQYGLYGESRYGYSTDRDGQSAGAEDNTDEILRRLNQRRSETESE